MNLDENQVSTSTERKSKISIRWHFFFISVLITMFVFACKCMPGLDEPSEKWSTLGNVCLVSSFIIALGVMGVSISLYETWHTANESKKLANSKNADNKPNTASVNRSRSWGTYLLRSCCVMYACILGVTKFYPNIGVRFRGFFVMAMLLSSFGVLWYAIILLGSLAEKLLPKERFAKEKKAFDKMGAIAVIPLFAFIIWSTSLTYKFCSEFTLRCNAQISALEVSLAPLLSNIPERLDYVDKSPQNKPQKPFLLVECNILYSAKPDVVVNIDKPQFFRHWQKFSLGDIGERMEYEIVEPPPAFKPKSIVIFAHSFQFSGRTVNRLGSGNLPELIDSGFIFVVNSETGKLQWRSTKFSGHPAKNTQGNGTHYSGFTEVSGDAIDVVTLKRELYKIPWE